METGLLKVNQRNLLGFHEGPGNQGPGTQKLLNIVMTLVLQAPVGVPETNRSVVLRVSGTEHRRAVSSSVLLSIFSAL